MALLELDLDVAGQVSTALFRCTARHADVAAAGFGNLVGVLDVDLRGSQPARPPSMEKVTDVTMAESSEAR